MDPLLAPVLILFGLGFIGWGVRKLRADARKPASEFRANPHVAPGTRVESSVMRVTALFDALQFVVIGVAVLAFGLIGLFG